MNKLEAMSGGGPARALAPVLIAGFLAACGGGGGGGDNIAGGGSTGDFDRNSLLVSIGERVLIPTYDAFNDRAGELETAINGYCAAVAADFAGADPTAARMAWRAAMDQWQIAEAIQIGPVAMNDGAIRNSIYSWPIENTCSVDQAVVEFDNDASIDVATLNIDQRGMSAIAYLLHAESRDHSCPASVALTQGWNARSEADREAARCDYAAAVAANVSTNAQSLVNAWDPSQGNYLAELANAGGSGSAFDSAQEALNVVSDALFYFEEDVKEMKLGEPLGVFANRCGQGVSCPEELEGLTDTSSNRRLDAVVYDTEYAKEMMRTNFVGFQLGFHGGDPADPAAVGFDDFLVALGEEAFADEMATDIQVLIDSVDEIDGTLGEALEAPITPAFDNVEAVYFDLQSVSTKLRNQFLSILGLQAPASSASDTD